MYKTKTKPKPKPNQKQKQKNKNINNNRPYTKVQGSVALKFGPAETATVNYTIRGETPETVTFIGTKGRIQIGTPAHAPTSVTITKATGERGAMASVTHDFPLPAVAPGLPPLVFPNSQGFQYEAIAVADAISKGLTEAPEWTLDETMDMMRYANPCVYTQPHPSCPCSGVVPNPPPFFFFPFFPSFFFLPFLL